MDTVKLDIATLAGMSLAEQKAWLQASEDAALGDDPDAWLDAWLQKHYPGRHNQLSHGRRGGGGGASRDNSKYTSTHPGLDGAMRTPMMRAWGTHYVREATGGHLSDEEKKSVGLGGFDLSRSDYSDNQGNDPPGFVLHQALAHHLKMDGKPHQVTEDELGAYIKGGEHEAWRGNSDASATRSATDINHQFRDGSYYYGRGVYGHGTYAAVDEPGQGTYAKREASAYAGGAGHGKLLHMSLKRDAKVIDYTDLGKKMHEVSTASTNREQAIYTKYGTDKTKWNKKTLNAWGKEKAMQQAFRYHGMAGMLLGYDAIRVDSTNHPKYYNVLNRSAFRVSGDDYEPE